MRIILASTYNNFHCQPMGSTSEYESQQKREGISTYTNQHMLQTTISWKQRAGISLPSNAAL
jgi:hypothetical protein